MKFVVDASVWTAAVDPADRFSGPSREWLKVIGRQGHKIVVPAFAIVEVACALARRLGDPEAGRRLAAGILNGPHVLRLPVDDVVLATALQTGTEAFLRGAEALYAAAAELMDATLIAWDSELIRRGGARSPSDWRAG